MSRTKKKPSKCGVSTRLRLKDQDELLLIKSAAERRGMGYNEFMRLITVGASKRVLAAPPEAILGQFAESAIDDLP